MDNEVIREYLIDFQKKEFPQMIERELNVRDSGKIKTIIGPRRAGKTFFLYQKMREMLKKGVNKENLVYLNFEDPRLIDFDFKEIREIIKLQWQIFPSDGKLHVFIDEPQEIKRWDIAVRALHDEGFDIYISGSNSKLLSKEIATSLRGRTLSYMLLPFSFKEFLKLRGLVDFKIFSSKEKANLMNLLDEYIEFGGFPEIILEKDKENKNKIIQEYFNLIVYRDIVERYKIKNTELIRWLIKSLINSYSREFSINKLYLILKSKGMRLSKNSLYSYASMLQDSMFAFFLSKFDYSARKKEFSINKAYINDVGFSKILESSKDLGKRMENVVFLELERRRKTFVELYYWKNVLQEEVDFVVKERKIKQLIQVCYDVDDYDTKKREMRSMLKASKELKCNNLLVITYDEDRNEIIDGKNVRFVSLWKWLLL